MLRLFTALTLPASLHQRLTPLQGGIPGARWTPPENFHLTLTFIGDVDDATAEDVDDALQSVRAPAFTLTPKGIGTFAQGEDPKVLWAGVEKCELLTHLKEKIDAALQSRHIEHESRKYIPHITLARFRHPDDVKIGDFIAAHNLFDAAPFDVTNFALFESRSTKNGPVYDILRSYPLMNIN